MIYLTKEWYDICQQTGLHFGMRAHKGTVRKDEELYQRLYKRKEREFIKTEREIYNVDPRFMLEIYGSVFVRADKFFSGDEICDEDKLIYDMPAEEKERITKLIEEYESRPPFDVDKCRVKFNTRQEYILSDKADKLPKELYCQIADHRVFALGYCTKEILKQLKRCSIENKKRVQNVLYDYTKAQLAQGISEELRKRFRFHDCVVESYKVDKDIVIRFVKNSGLSEHNKIVFRDAKIIKQEKPLEGSIWLYEELYCSQYGYEAHMLLTSDSVHEITISCKDIIIDD